MTELLTFIKTCNVSTVTCLAFSGIIGNALLLFFFSAPGIDPCLFEANTSTRGGSGILAQLYLWHANGIQFKPSLSKHTHSQLLYTCRTHAHTGPTSWHPYHMPIGGQPHGTHTTCPYGANLMAPIPHAHRGPTSFL